MSVWESGRTSMAVWMTLAGALGFMTEQRRPCGIPLLGLLLILVSFRQMLVGYPLLVWTDWTHAWGIVAAMNSAWCWLVAIAFGLQAAIRCAPSFGKQLAPMLFGLLCLNLLSIVLQRTFGLSIWLYQEHEVGLFINGTVWGAWCAVSFPILWRWRRWAIIPAVIGLLMAESTSSVLALSVGLLWMNRSRLTLRRVLLGMAILSLGIFLIEKQYHFSDNVSARINTWIMVLGAIRDNPLGIGWHVMAYGNAIKQYSGALPHPGSDVLRMILECGWFTVPILLSLAWRGWKQLGLEALSISLVISAALALIQNALSVAQIGILAMVVWLNWHILQQEGVSTT